MNITNKLQSVITIIINNGGSIVNLEELGTNEYEIEFLVFTLEAEWVYNVDDMQLDRISYSFLQKALRVKGKI